MKYARKEMNLFVNIKERYPFFKDLDIVNILKYYIKRKDFHIDIGDELDIIEQYMCESNVAQNNFCTYIRDHCMVPLSTGSSSSSA